MLVKINHGGLYSSTGEKKQKAQFTKAQLPSPNRGNQTRAAGGAATKWGLGAREEKQGEAEIHKKKWTQRNDLLPGTSGSQSSGNNCMIAPLKQPSFVSDDKVQAYSSAPQVTMQLLSGERERESTKETLTEILASKRWAEPHNYSSSAAKINQ